MPTQFANELLETVNELATQLGQTSSDPALHTQAAFVRSMVDEVRRYHPSEHWIAPLHEQLAEELGRLQDLAACADCPPARPLSGTADRLDVLAVDDDPAALAAIAVALGSMGYRARAAGDAAEALRAHEQSPAAIVVSDWSMPGTSGVALCAALKRRPDGPYVILVSAFHDDARLVEEARGCADDLLGKPLDLDELELRLSAASRLVRAMRSVAALQRAWRA